jgi:hypothetical protein
MTKYATRMSPFKYFTPQLTADEQAVVERAEALTE